MRDSQTSPEFLRPTLRGGDVLDRGEHRRTTFQSSLLAQQSVAPDPGSEPHRSPEVSMSSTIMPSSSSFDYPPDDQRNLFAPENADQDPANWMVRGACRGADPGLFFPISLRGRATEQINFAKAVCGRCAVSGSCLSYALRTMPDGIWADNQRRTHRDACPVGRAFPGSGRKARSGRSWPGRQWWIPNRIENRLRADDRRLSSMFAVFARLTRAEAIPAAERIETAHGAWRRGPEPPARAAAAQGRRPRQTPRPHAAPVLIHYFN